MFSHTDNPISLLILILLFLFPFSIIFNLTSFIIRVIIRNKGGRFYPDMRILRMVIAS